MTQEPQNEDLFSLVQRLAGLGCWEWNVTTNVVTWSAQLYSIYGLDEAKFGASFEAYLERVHVDDRQRVQTTIGEALQSKDEFRFEERIVRPNGEIRVLESTGMVVRDAQGAPQKMVGACMDVTDARALQQTLRLADRMAVMGTLAAGVGHELNNPLSYVTNNAELLQDRFRDHDAQTSAAIEHILIGAERMRGIIRDISAFARPRESSLGAVDVAATVRGALQLLSSQLRHRAQLDVQLQQVFVCAAEAELGQVVLNTVANAVQAIPVGAAREHRIRVHCRAEAETAVIEVEDTGGGIAADDLERVCEPFFTTKPVGQGTGLGLFVCHRIVSDLGGTLEVSNGDRGALVRVTLPATADRPVVESEESDALPTFERRLRILLIDDDDLVLDAFAAVLRDHDVVRATSGRQALSEVADNPGFDAVICDMMMPQMTGAMVLRELQQRAPTLANRILFVTGGAFTPEAQAFAERYPDHLLEKPVRRIKLLAALRQLVERAD